MFNEKRGLLIAASLAFLATTSVAFAQDAKKQTSGGFAIVGATGKLQDGYNVSQLNHMGAGVFKVTFDGNVGGCASVATIGDSGTAGTFGFIEVSNPNNDSMDVTVSEFNSVTTQPADFPFDLVTTCPKGH